YTAEDSFAPTVINELQRRFSFEFCGMRNHEIYFSHFEGGSSPITPNSPLSKAIEEEWGSFDAWLTRFKAIALTRGIGWAMLYYDKKTNRLLNNWNDEQHLGHLVGLTPVLALDMWEHAFLLDFGGEKPKYVEAFFENLNWQNVEENFASAQG
ncbi:MAG: Fe-Mn family superoxide dismutase, partial [Parcubacteria group bacterium]